MLKPLVGLMLKPLVGIFAVPLCLSACFMTQLPAPVPPPLAAVNVGNIDLQQAATAPDVNVQLDVGIRIFGNEFKWGQEFDESEWVFNEIRESEAHYLPYELRNTLTASNQWGAVRVLPDNDPSMDLMIEGTILRSDGAELVLRVTARDSSGRLWLEESYRATATREDYPESGGGGEGSGGGESREGFNDPFKNIYNRISNDLSAQRDELSATELQSIKTVATLVYANDLAPDAFAHFIATNITGRIGIVSLPAESDPILLRVKDMRQRHYLFIDRVDDYYQALYQDMQAPYLVWRNYSHNQQREYQDEQARSLVALNSERRSGGSGNDSYLALIQRYNKFRWAKVYDQEFTDLAEGFSSEVTPAVLELNRQVEGLSGTVEEQYAQWRRILRELFELETGQSAGL
ncbi:MAG: hypothetical protein ACR2PR_06785 [Pseudohongiellaceae bacterium]